jgi:cardiolipin synthase
VNFHTLPRDRAALCKGEEQMSLNLPNILSLIRLCAVPLVPLVYFSSLPGANWMAAAIYLAAALTDVLDGYLARKFNLITKLGRVLDPLADKMMAFCVLVCIIIEVEDSRMFWAGVIFFVKEVCMGLGALVQYKKIHDVPPSNIIGKISTIYFFIVCIVLLVYPDIHSTVRVVAISTALGMNILAFLIYMVRFIKNRKNQE